MPPSKALKAAFLSMILIAVGVYSASGASLKRTIRIPERNFGKESMEQRAFHQEGIIPVQCDTEQLLKAIRDQGLEAKIDNGALNIDKVTDSRGKKYPIVLHTAFSPDGALVALIIPDAHARRMFLRKVVKSMDNFPCVKFTYGVFRELPLALLPLFENPRRQPPEGIVTQVLEEPGSFLVSVLPLEADPDNSEVVVVIFNQKTGAQAMARIGIHTDMGRLSFPNWKGATAVLIGGSETISNDVMSALVLNLQSFEISDIRLHSQSLRSPVDPRLKIASIVVNRLEDPQLYIQIGPSDFAE